MPEVTDNNPAPEAHATLLVHLPAGDLTYVATAGLLPVTEADGTPIASMFTLAYTCGEVPEPTRPVTFLFNGGPGSASLWLNVGGVGPVRARTRTPLPTPPAPYDIVDNVHTLLTHSDLVFLDAPGSGFSTFAPGVDPSRAWGVDADIDVFARAIRAWLTANGRWSSPTYLYGESYGTLRAAGLANALQNSGLDLNGIVLQSAILDFAAAAAGTDQALIALLPSYALTARYHGVAGADRSEEDVLAEAIDFSQGEYAAALQRGDELPADRERSLAERLTGLIGIDADELVRRHLRVGMEDFRTLLLAADGRVIGRFDARFTAPAEYVAGTGPTDPATDDAATAGVTGAEVAAFHDQLRRIGFRSGLPYRPLNNMEVEGAWEWSHRPPGAAEVQRLPSTAPDLSAAMRRNPGLRVLVISGTYDLATPFLGVRHDIAHLFLSPPLRGNITLRRYASGHMTFVDEAALAALAADLRAFYDASVVSGR